MAALKDALYAKMASLSLSMIHVVYVYKKTSIKIMTSAKLVTLPAFYVMGEVVLIVLHAQ